MKCVFCVKIALLQPPGSSTVCFSQVRHPPRCSRNNADSPIRKLSHKHKYISPAMICQPYFPRLGAVKTNGEGGIRTRGTSIHQYDGLANRCLQPLGHLSEQSSDNLHFVSSYCKKISGNLQRAKGKIVEFLAVLKREPV
jgi:hypothetical protein